ncbi:MAG: sigma-70 family RNA polymerase sigma factor [Acidobacteria bacterium]|nr:sigma-70 family RNA polymerase sigma factor [Acidobacteriota bacterium]
MDTEIALSLNRPAAPDPTTSDPRLVVEAQAGGRAALDELARRMRGPAYVLALQLVGNRDDALDIAQDALLRLFQHLRRVAPDRPVRPWLFAIVRNRARDLWRSRAARPSESLDARPDLAAHLAATAADPEHQAARRQQARRIWTVIGSLSEPHREILVLRDFHDLAYAEIAHVLGIPTGTVMSRLHAARAALRNGLEAEGGRHG